MRSCGRTPTLVLHWTCQQCGRKHSGNKQETEISSELFSLKLELNFLIKIEEIISQTKKQALTALTWDKKLIKVVNAMYCFSEGRDSTIS